MLISFYFKCVKEFEDIDEFILAEEQRHNAATETGSRLNFGLIEVVYEWARNKVSLDII